MASDPSGRGSDGVKVDVIAANDLPGVTFDDYEAVVLLNVPAMAGELGEGGALTYPQVDALEAYVSGGGGLLVCLGERIILDFYNGPFHRDGAGLSPYRIGPWRGDETDWDAYVRFDGETIDQTSQAVPLFHGGGRDLTRLIRIFAYVPVEEMPLPATDDAGAPHVLARFTGADALPAIVSRQYGDGQVLWLYTTIGRRWSDWCDDQPRGLYVTAIQDMLLALARGQADRAGVRVDEAIEAELPPMFTDAQVTLRLPDYPVSDLISLGASDAEDADPAMRLYPQADQAGIYAVQALRPDGEVLQQLFARNSDPREGQLAQAGKSRLVSLFGKERLTYRDADDLETGAEMLVAKGEEYWLWLMGTLIVLIALETVLAQKFGHYSE